MPTTLTANSHEGNHDRAPFQMPLRCISQTSFPIFPLNVKESPNVNGSRCPFLFHNSLPASNALFESHHFNLHFFLTSVDVSLLHVFKNGMPQSFTIIIRLCLFPKCFTFLASVSTVKSSTFFSASILMLVICKPSVLSSSTDLVHSDKFLLFIDGLWCYPLSQFDLHLIL